jgi:hypothetical protein
MKALLISLLLMLSTSVFAVEQCHTGSWFNPDRNGEGINIEFNDGLVVAYFYTFDQDGQQVWYTMVGDRVLTIETTVIVEDESDFITKTVDSGVADIEIITDNVLVFKYNLILDNDGDEFFLCEGDQCKAERVYERITQPIPCGK